MEEERKIILPRLNCRGSMEARKRIIIFSTCRCFKNLVIPTCQRYNFFCTYIFDKYIFLELSNTNVRKKKTIRS